jgi:hypothetical protein
MWASSHTRTSPVESAAPFARDGETPSGLAFRQSWTERTNRHYAAIVNNDQFESMRADRRKNILDGGIQ